MSEDRLNREIGMWAGAFDAFSNDAHIAFEVVDHFSGLTQHQADVVASATYLYWAQIFNYAEWGDRVMTATDCTDVAFCAFATYATRTRAANNEGMR